MWGQERGGAGGGGGEGGRRGGASPGPVGRGSFHVLQDRGSWWCRPGAAVDPFLTPPALEGGGVSEAGGEGLGGGTVGCRCGPMAGASVGYRCGFMGGRCGVQVWAHGGLQPLGLNSQKGQLPRGCPQGSQARCEHVTSQLQSKDGGEQRRNREDVWILTLPAR